MESPTERCRSLVTSLQGALKAERKTECARATLCGLAVIAATSLVSSCATSPTGKRQMLMLSDSQMNTMGAQGFEQLKAEKPVETSKAVNGYVQCIAGALLAVTEDPTGVESWETVVFKDESANAFALPGGKIGVHTGLMRVASTQEQLATVVGHEIGHVVARHGNDRVSRGMMTGLIAQGAQVALGHDGLSTTDQAILLVAMGGISIGYTLPHGRSQESEADEVGIMLMAKAGFDPRQSIKLWENMARAGGGGGPEFLSTHPSHETRQKKLTKLLEEAVPAYEAALAAGSRPNCPVPQLPPAAPTPQSAPAAG